MIRYLYNRQVAPRAPFVDVSLRCTQSFLLFTYRVEVTLHSLSPQTVEVCAHADEPHILLAAIS